VHLWFWPSVPLMARKVVSAPLTMQTVEDRKVELESLPLLMSFDAAVALKSSRSTLSGVPGAGLARAPPLPACGGPLPVTRRQAGPQGQAAAIRRPAGGRGSPREVRKGGEGSAHEAAGKGRLHFLYSWGCVSKRKGEKKPKNNKTDSRLSKISFWVCFY